MSLQETLRAIKEQFATQVPAEAKAVMAESTQALIESGVAENSLKKGDVLPPFSLKDSTGETRHVGELADGRPLVMSFFRGFW